jgi:hypothetical protein
MAGNMDPNEIEGVAEAMEELRKGSNLSAESLTKIRWEQHSGLQSS